MSETETPETVADIVRELHDQACFTNTGYFNDIADRVAAAYRREMDALTADRDHWMRMALDEDARANAMEAAR